MGIRAAICIRDQHRSLVGTSAIHWLQIFRCLMRISHPYPIETTEILSRLTACVLAMPPTLRAMRWRPIMADYAISYSIISLAQSELVQKNVRVVFLHVIDLPIVYEVPICLAAPRTPQCCHSLFIQTSNSMHKPQSWIAILVIRSLILAI